MQFTIFHQVSIVFERHAHCPFSLASYNGSVFSDFLQHHPHNIVQESFRFTVRNSLNVPWCEIFDRPLEFHLSCLILRKVAVAKQGFPAQPPPLPILQIIDFSFITALFLNELSSIIFVLETLFLLGDDSCLEILIIFLWIASLSLESFILFSKILTLVSKHHRL